MTPINKKIMKKGLVCGPWVGEFGWELFAWQAFCRSAASGYDLVVVLGRSGHDYIYGDFCHAYFAVDPPVDGVAESFMNSAVPNIERPDGALRALASALGEEKIQNIEWVWFKPCRIGNPPYDHPKATVNIPGIGEIKPNYKLFRGHLDKPENAPEIILHARNRKIRSHENWSIEKWNSLVKALGPNIKVGCIGTKDGAMLVDGAVDLRGEDLKKVVAHLRHARAIVGPSSGPMHLASLSGCPQVWWTDNPNKNYPRYKYMWNPFNTETLMVPGKDPSVNEVIETIKSL